MTQRTVRVLVVDDEQDMRAVVGLNLKLAGMDYGEAADGGEALRMFESDEWDACILDLMMPRKDGFHVLENAGSEVLERVAIIVLSAQGSPTAALKALDMGAHAHLTKPFSPAAVAQVVDELVALDPGEREARRRESIERAGALERLGMPTI